MGEPGPTVYMRARVCVNAQPRPSALPRELNRQLDVGAFIERLLLPRHPTASRVVRQRLRNCRRWL